jgi:hypothetical protein
MSLGDLQSALGSMVVAQASGHRSLIGPLGSFGSLDLSAEERAWLTGLADSAGFKVTCKIQRWWRQTKLQTAVELTLAALGAAKGAELMNTYLDVTPCTSLFFIPEAVGFLEFVAGAAKGRPHVVEVAQFERAILLARQAAIDPSGSQPLRIGSDPTEQIRPHPAADVVLFAASPELVLGSILGDRSLPEEQMRKSPVLIAPRLSRLWRPATDDEYRLFERSRHGATKEQLVALLPGAADTLKNLVNAGAFSELQSGVEQTRHEG